MTAGIIQFGRNRGYPGKMITWLNLGGCRARGRLAFDLQMWRGRRRRGMESAERSVKTIDDLLERSSYLGSNLLSYIRDVYLIGLPVFHVSFIFTFHHILSLITNGSEQKIVNMYNFSISKILTYHRWEVELTLMPLILRTWVRSHSNSLGHFSNMPFPKM